MYSSFIRVALAFIGFSPVLLSLYLVGMINKYDHLFFRVRFSYSKEFILDLLNLIQTNYLLLIFCAFCWAGVWIVTYAKRNLSIGRIELKSVKPSDGNFGTVLFGIILPFYKIYDPSLSDAYYLVGFLLTAIIFSVTMKSSFHYNIILKHFLGYKHYEVATTGEVTYLLLSKQKIVNKKQVESYVYITDHMLINMSENNK